jgi:cytochrome c-type biogenesis protein CcmH
VSSVVKSFTVCRRSLLAGVLLAGLALGATSDGGARFSTLGHRLMCTCGCGQVLLECNHVGCRSSARMRSELLAAIQRGESDDQILNWFAAKYGPVVLAAPANRGFNRIAWLMPYAALLGGLTLAGAVLRRWRSRSQPAPLAGAAPRTSEKLEALRRKVHEETEI